MSRAVFIDRDGTINRAYVRHGKPFPPQTLEEFELLPGAESAIRSLHDAGFRIIVVTNQPDVATGKQSREVVDAMHELMLSTLLIDDIKACYEIDSEACTCYKPKPGMLIDAAKQYHLNLAESYMVGDRWRDIGAGKAAGCFTIFIENDYDEPVPSDPGAIVSSLSEAAKLILANCAYAGGSQ